MPAIRPTWRFLKAPFTTSWQMGFVADTSLHHSLSHSFIHKLLFWRNLNAPVKTGAAFQHSVWMEGFSPTCQDLGIFMSCLQGQIRQVTKAPTNGCIWNCTRHCLSDDWSGLNLTGHLRKGDSVCRLSLNGTMFENMLSKSCNFPTRYRLKTKSSRNNIKCHQPFPPIPHPWPKFLPGSIQRSFCQTSLLVLQAAPERETIQLCPIQAKSCVFSPEPVLAVGVGLGRQPRQSGGPQTTKKKNQKRTAQLLQSFFVWFLETIHNRPWRKSCQMAVASNAGWNTRRRTNLPEKAACWQSSRIQFLKHPNLHCLPLALALVSTACLSLTSSICTCIITNFHEPHPPESRTSCEVEQKVLEPVCGEKHNYHLSIHIYVTRLRL